MTSDVARSSRTLADRYEFVEVVGRGGMGEVWGRPILRGGLGRKVAVKPFSAMMASEAGVRERFEAEARSAAALSHPDVALFHSGEDDGTPGMVMDRLPGRTLADELALDPQVPEQVHALRIEVLGALAASHQAGNTAPRPQAGERVVPKPAGGSLPERLERAIGALEKAVQP